MSAKVKITKEQDRFAGAIAKAAHVPDPMQVCVREDTLIVEGVSQQALENALASFDPVTADTRDGAAILVNELEATITPRRLREAAIGVQVSIDFIAAVDAKIAALRATLK